MECYLVHKTSVTPQQGMHCDVTTGVPTIDKVNGCVVCSLSLSGPRHRHRHGVKNVTKQFPLLVSSHSFESSVIVHGRNTILTCAAHLRRSLLLSVIHVIRYRSVIKDPSGGLTRPRWPVSSRKHCAIYYKYALQQLQNNCSETQ